MDTIAIVSMKGGTGRTTVAANVGALLTRNKDSRVLLLDFDPRNQVGLHLGLDAMEPGGLCRATLEGVSWARALHRRTDQAPFLPFGHTDDEDRLAFERLLRERPALLGQHLADPALEHFDCAIIDCAAGPSIYLQHVLRTVDVALAVVLPDAASFATMPELYAQLEARTAAHRGAGGAFVLINAMDQSRELARDIQSALATPTGPHAPPLLPFVIHHDQAVREALAFQRPVAEQAPTSQAAADLRELAAWVCDRMADVLADKQATDEQGFPDAESAWRVG